MRIAIVRGADALHELVHEVHELGDAARPWLARHACVLRRTEPPRGSVLAEAWHGLAEVTAWDAVTARRVAAVLAETVSSGEAAGELAALGEEVHAAAPPKATAAHPRAYRGTKHRPPRPRRPEPVDVRRYLLARRHIDQVLAQLPPIEDAGRGGELEPWFATHVAPLVGEGPWLMQLAVVARAAELAGDAELRAACVGVLALIVRTDDRAPNPDPARARASALAWWSHILAHPRDERREVACMVYGSRAWSRPPGQLDEVMAEVSTADPAQRWAIYGGYAGWATTAYLIGGLRLARSRPGLSMADPPGGIHDVEALVRTTIERIGDAADRDSGAAFWTMHLWRMCGRAPVMTALLEDPALAALEPRAAFWLLKLAASPSWNPDDADAATEYAFLARATRAMAARAVALVPAYQLKLVEDIIDVYWSANDGEREQLEAVLAFGTRIAERVARAPFTTEPMLGYTARRWRDLPPAHLDALLAAPDDSFRELEGACTRGNDAVLIGNGLAELFRVVPDFALAAFRTCPRALIAAADALAALSGPAAREVLAAFRALPLAGEAVAALPIEELVAALAFVVEPAGRRGPDPIRRALRDHLAGRRALTPAQLRGHHARILAELARLRCAAIARLAERALASRARTDRIETPALRHALALIVEADENRRPLQRMLAALAAGDVAWRRRHPATQAWFANHPRIDQERWLAGMAMRAGELELAIELDPLEVLRAGTYAGSCLGRGGDFSYSAAAIALDANKHIIYARRRGAVCARQLVALSEAGELVCFHVYGPVRSEALERAFADFDRRLAAALGVPIYAGRDEGYGIASILSQRWWDDGAWELPPSLPRGEIEVVEAAQ